jgi:hypothetical protein
MVLIQGRLQPSSPAGIGQSCPARPLHCIPKMEHNCLSPPLAVGTLSSSVSCVNSSSLLTVLLPWELTEACGFH